MARRHRSAAGERTYTADVDAILAAVTDRKREIVFFANPNNPTGTYVQFDEIRRLHQELPPHVLLVLDAAYAEYVRRNDYEAGIELVSNSENVVMTRTFSKIHGLAALRLGWMYGPDHVVDAVNRIRGPFNVNTAHERCRHRRHPRHCPCATVGGLQREMAVLAHHEIGKVGLAVTPSVATSF